MTIKLSGGYAWLPGVQAIKVLGVNGPASYGDLELQLLHEQVFICKGAAQQFLMSSVCLSVRQQSWNSAFLQNSECSRMLQNVTECSRMHAECIQDVQECIQNVPECMELHKLASSYISLLSWSSMSLHAVPLFVWAAHKNFAVLVSFILKTKD